jgi:hypothetical protein
LVTTYLGHENVVVGIYNEELLLTLLIEATNLLMLANVEEIKDKICFTPQQQMYTLI